MDGALDQVRSLLGIAVIVGVGVLCSEDRRAIRWRIVLSGLALQLVFGVIVLKTEPGRAFFEWIGVFVNKLIDFTLAGSTFVFGSLASAQGGAGFVFAFKVLPTVIFVGALMSVLYHLGVMQRVVQAMSVVMARVMGVSGAESLAAAVNVFVGQTEAPLVIRPYLAAMTRSELMAVMTGGFATVAGGVLVAYVGMGISAEHLLAASVMSAPAALVMAKLFVPERETPATLGLDYVPIEKVSANALDAAATGASDGVKLAINVGAMLIAFIALVALVDWLLGHIGSMILFVVRDVLGANVVLIGIRVSSFGAICGTPVFLLFARHKPSQVRWKAAGLALLTILLNAAILVSLTGELTLARYLGWVFAPLAFAIGVPWKDCVAYGGLLGTQLSLNEFMAYAKLAELTPTALEPGGFSTRAAMLATYSLCGFANVGSIGIQLGGIGSLAESRRPDIARLAARGMIAGFLACNLTASVAGLLVSNAEADYRHARAVARGHLARGELEPAAAILRKAAERNPGHDWGVRATDDALRLDGWRRDVQDGKRPLDAVVKETL